MDRRHLLKLLGTATAFAGWTPFELEGLLKAGGTQQAGVAFFTEAQREVVTTLCDLIIPTTDTPGSVATGGVEYIELIVSEWYEEEERDRFMRGLAHLDDHTQTTSGSNFAEAPEGTQVAILKGLEAEGRALAEANPEADEPFFHQARGLVLHGYYTSEVGMKDEQMFVERPTFYEGDVPLVELIRRSGGR